jgi:tRNA (guanine6-N2)-methyltransferase
MTRRSPARRAPGAPHDLLEADLLDGLADFAVEELRTLFGAEARLDPPIAASSLRFSTGVPLGDLLRLRSVTALYLSLTFDVPRPKALLGHQHFERLVAAIERVQALHPPGAFSTLRLSAAGEDSAVLTRLRDELARRTALATASDEGDLLLRLRRVPGASGWEVLVRLSPRPLATRRWRVCNMPGAPNATLAFALAQLTEPAPEDRVLNLCCGSGTLIVERLAVEQADTVIGCDIDVRTLDCAAANLRAAGFEREARLETWDATSLPLPDGWASVVVADLPFGQIVGSHRENEQLYPRLFAEATRVAAPAARMALLTHEVRLLERVASDYRADWELDAVVRVRSSGMTPRIYLYRRY